MERLATPERIAIVSLGKNWQRELHPAQPIEGTQVTASMDTMQSAIAAGLRYLERKQQLGDAVEDVIIFSTGHTLGEPGNDGINRYPTEADMMELEFRKVFSPEEIPNKVVFKEQHSIDTAGNAEEVGMMLDHLGISKAEVVTVRRHGPRAGKLFRTYNPNTAIDTVITEDVLTQYDINVVEIEDKEKEKEARLERILNALLTVDPRGRIPRIITRLTRK